MKSIRRAWQVLVVLAGAMGCGGPVHVPPELAPGSGDATGSEPPPSPEQRAETIVIVALDGVRWQDVFHGVEAARAGIPRSECQAGSELMPNLHRLATLEGAAVGAPEIGPPMRASGPRYVSLPGYSEILTGRPSPCVDNECTLRPEATLADEAAAIRGERGSFVLSSWPVIGRVASGHSDRVVVSTGREGGENLEPLLEEAEGRRLLQEGAAASPAPGYGHFRPDRHTGALALHVLVRHRPRFLFVSLGEPDEYAHHNDYEGYLASLRAADAFIGEIASVLADAGEWGDRATLFVTTDHGRADTFHNHGDDWESGRVWLVGAGAGISARGAVASPVSRRLADIAPTARALFGLAPDRHPRAGAPLSELWSEGTTEAQPALVR